MRKNLENKFKVFCRNILLAGLVGLGHGLVAQISPPLILPLAEAELQAKANNPELKAAAFEIQAQQALRPAAYELPKTNFDLQLGQYNSNHFDQSINIRQDIPNPRNKRSGLALADANVRSAELSRTVTETRLIYEVRSAWYELVFLEEKKRLFQQQDSLATQFVQVAELRLKTGETSPLERATAQSQSAEAKNQLMQVKADIAIAQSRLQMLLASSQPIGIPAGTRLEKRPLELAGDVTGNPILAWYQQQVAVSEATIGVEQAKRSPDFSIGYLNQSLMTPESADPNYNSLDRFHVLQAGVAVPIFGKAQKARIEAAKLEREVAQANAEAQKNQLVGEQYQAVQAYEKQRQALEYFEKTALPTADFLLSGAQTAFRAGDVDYVEFVQALARAQSIRLAYLDALNSYNQSVIQLQFFNNQ